MADPQVTQARLEAAENFYKARRRARRSQIASALTGRENRLLPFESIRQELRLQNPMYAGVKMIETKSIVGTVGRYTDFTRGFLPLNDSMRDRWINVESLTAKAGWPPIEVYKVGDAYFVKDGNHRTAIARQMGLATIEAHVWEYPQVVSLSSAENLDDVLIRLGKQHFTETTAIDKLIPEHEITFTVPGRYSELFVQIEDMRGKLNRIDETEVGDEDIVINWYELIYLPTVQVIHDTGLLEEFPGRTEADLFVWLSRHRYRLADRYGEYENLADLARQLGEIYGEEGVQRVSRQVRNLLGGDELPKLPAVEEVLAEETEGSESQSE